MPIFEDGEVGASVRTKINDAIEIVDNLGVQGITASANYATRQNFVDAVAGGLFIANGGIVHANGIKYKSVSGSTSIADLPGFVISDADIKTQYESNTDTNAFTDADKSKLDDAPITFDDVAALLADTGTYADDTYLATNGEGFSYKAVSSGGDGRVQNAGLQWLEVQPVGGKYISTSLGITGVGDESAKVQSLWNVAGSSGLPWVLVESVTAGSTLYINNSASRGECLGEITYTGAAYCVDFNRVSGNYPVSLDLLFRVRLTADSQYAMAERYSFSEVKLFATLNSVSCTNCRALRSMGDVSAGSGPYYNKTWIRAQGNHQSGTIMHTTEPDDGVFTGSRGPNANIYFINRSGQFDTHIYDRVGSGNKWVVQAAEAASAPTSTLIYAGHNSTAASLSQNQYDIQYTENVDNIFVSPSSTFGTGLKLYQGMATGGQAISDASINVSGDTGILQVIDAPAEWRQEMSSTRPFSIKTPTSTYPAVESLGVPGIELKNTTANLDLLLASSASFSQGTHSARMFINNTEFFRAGTTRWSPTTNNSADLGATAEQFRNIYAGTSYLVGGTKVVGAQGAAVADATGGANIDTEARDAINALLSRLRTHGLIDT